MDKVGIAGIEYKETAFYGKRRLKGLGTRTSYPSMLGREALAPQKNTAL